MPGVSVIEGTATLLPSALVGEAGGGPAASAAAKTPAGPFGSASSASAAAAPPPNPPHKGEGLRRLTLPAGAIGRARALRKTMTDAERTLWAGLREAFPDTHWRHQVPFGRYIADFCAHSAKLIIEVDGGQHSPEVDASRTRFLETHGYRVLRFWNNDVLQNLSGVLQTIGDHLPSPLVGEFAGSPCHPDTAANVRRTFAPAHGGGPAASAAEKTSSQPQQYSVPKQ